MNLIFSQHAAQRWFERCKGLVLSEEVSSLRRFKHFEKKAKTWGFPGHRCYKTLSGIKLIVSRDGIVVTVLR